MKIKVDSDKIKLWRKERLWSQEQVAEKAGISLRTIQRIENNGAASHDSAALLANVFEADVNDFLIDENGQNEKATDLHNSKVSLGLRMSFGIHLIGFVIGMVTFLVIEFVAGNPTQWSMMVPAGFWFVGLVAHGGTVLLVEFVQKMQNEIQELESAG
ncbi:MAG: helix-turn-helix domain-containing protein [Anaerolineae bacterium]